MHIRLWLSFCPAFPHIRGMGRIHTFFFTLAVFSRRESISTTDLFPDSLPHILSRHTCIMFSESPRSYLN